MSWLVARGNERKIKNSIIFRKTIHLVTSFYEDDVGRYLERKTMCECE